MSARVPGARAARKLRRTRLVMTVLFTVATAICLTLLAALALQIDSTSRAEQLASDVAERAGGLARAVYFDQAVLHLEPLTEDELARGATSVAVYRLDGPSQDVKIAYRSAAEPDLLSASQLAALVADVVDEQGMASDTLHAPDGDSIAWAAAPVWNSDAIGAVVVVGQGASAESAAHDRLALGLALGCVVLLLAAGAAGFALSGRAMRPAARALERQEQFLTEAAHELRTPLTTLRLLAESGESGGSDRALDAVDRLDRLITGLLARARIDAGTFEPERIALRLDQLVQQVVDEVGDPDRLTLTSEPVVVTGDPVLLGQAVRNLIENALRYAPDVPVRVVVTPGLVSVRDGGPGIPARDRVRVTQRGVGTGPGTGTGLAIVSWVAELHGGSLSLSDEPGGGLRADMRMPVRD